jgi:hypothetical protein
MVVVVVKEVVNRMLVVVGDLLFVQHNHELMGIWVHQEFHRIQRLVK